MKELEEQRVYVNFFCKLGKKYTETFQLLNQTYGEIVSSTKKGTDESVKDQGVVGCVFLLERHCPS